MAMAGDGVETRARARERLHDDIASAARGEPIPGLPLDVVVTHVLGKRHLPDPADLAALRAVSREMREAVDATGREIEDYREDNAAHFGYLTTLRCYQRYRGLRNESRLCQAAARNGDLEALKALRDENVPWNELTCSYAALGGHFEVLKWLHEEGCDWDMNTCAHAALKGHFEILKWARANGCPWDDDVEGEVERRAAGGPRAPATTFESAAAFGSIEILTFLHHNGCPWNEMTCKRAAERGNIEVLKWLRENGCPWDETSCAHAAMGARLEALQWLRANGCPWDSRACAYAAMGGHIEVLQWLRENGCPWCKPGCVTAATAMGHAATLEWILSTEDREDPPETHPAPLARARGYPREGKRGSSTALPRGIGEPGWRVVGSSNVEEGFRV